MRVFLALRASTRSRSGLLAPLAIGFLLASGVATADIVSTTGQITVLDPPPPSVVTGALESDTEIFVFAEREGTTLASDLTAVVATPGLSIVGSALPATGTVSAGTIVDSYLFHADKVGSTGTVTVAGTVTFDADILGVLVRTSSLTASDGALGSPTTLYSTEANRGFENVDDLVTISSDLRTISVQFYHGQVEDEIRVVTAAGSAPAVPIGSWVGPSVLAAALGSQWWRMRRRRSDA